LNTKDIHRLPRIICGIGIVSTGIGIGIVSTGIGIGVIITGVNTWPSCEDGLLIGEADGLDEVLEAVRLGEARAVPAPPCELVPPDEDGLLEDDGLDEVLEAVRLGDERDVPAPPFELVPLDAELLGDEERVDVLFDLALNLLLP